jgi:diguanylate cyclase (GGDEF)-like protein/PAS domain S-box-containing protein
MGNWTMFPDGRMECSAELRRLFVAGSDAAHFDFADDFLKCVLQADRGRVGGARSRLMAEAAPYQIEFQIERFDGAVRTIFEQAGLVPGEHGRPGRIEGITQDITDRVQAQERIRKLAHYDSTTGLPNRQFFAELAGPSLERTRRNGKRCAVMCLDIDRFNGVNDAFGRSQGEDVLKTVAVRLRSWIRGSDLSSVGQAPTDHGVLASGGGSVFTLLIADLEGQEQASVVAQRLLLAVAEPIMVETQPLVLTASIGIAFFPNDADDFAGLARCAEQAVHAAQDAGRAQHRFFDERMNADAATRLLLETELRRAIGFEELRLYFQPKVDAATRRIVGAEALVRWQHPDRGLLSPIEFIALAEETGLIMPLTDWVLETACGNLRAWLDAGLGTVPLSVNLSAPGIVGGSLAAKLDGLIERFGLNADCLTLEMTETMLMRDANAAVPQLEMLRARGYGLSLDDFGTGYSSLSYLKRFPVNELKIDRAFVTDVELGGRDAALAAAIIALSRELGLKVVAEGVETRAQSEFLLKRGCRVQQGYLFSKPVPAAAFATLLRTGLPAPLHTALSQTGVSPAQAAQGHRVAVPNFATAAQLQHDVAGVAIRMTGVNFDITARKQAELDLKHTASLLRRVLDSASDLSIIATTPDLTVSVFNKGAERLTGYAGIEFIGRATPAVLHDASEVKARGFELSNLLGRPVHGAGVFHDPTTLDVPREWTYIRKNQRRVPVLLNISAMFDEFGNLSGYLGVARDITRDREHDRSLQDAKSAAERANSAKSEFLANMSHEIRTPLNAVIGLGYLLEQTPLSEEQRSLLLEINFAGRSLLSVINNVLDISKIEAGQMRSVWGTER